MLFFLTDFPQKLIISLEPICVIVTNKLLRYLQNSRRYRADKFLMIHRYTHTHTHTHTQTQGLAIYMADFILPCNKNANINLCHIILCTAQYMSIGLVDRVVLYSLQWAMLCVNTTVKKTNSVLLRRQTLAIFLVRLNICYY